MDYKVITPKFKKKKVSNIIAIGGMIAAGKTTLVDELAEELKVEKVYELEDNDEVVDVLLKQQYEKKPIPAAVFQLYFFLKRFENYCKYSKSEKPIIIDRTFWEDRLFAYQNMINDPSTFSFYDNIWKEKIQEIMEVHGVPKIYVIIDVDWETFKERIFKRNRKMETDNFNENEEYFSSLNKIYLDYLKNTCEVYGIDYIVLDAKMPNGEKIKQIKTKLNELDKQAKQDVKKKK